LELIDSFLERTQGQFPNVFVVRCLLPFFLIELLQLVELLSCVLQLTAVFDAHRTFLTSLNGEPRLISKPHRSRNCLMMAAASSPALTRGMPTCEEEAAKSRSFSQVRSGSSMGRHTRSG
jgi:hypothetical protein